MIAASLFSGIGAPETAMPEWDWRWCAEIEKFPSAVLAARHPHSINLGDVRADDFAERAADIARPDVIVFGSPCQSYSIAGKRLGLDDPRGNLALVALGIIDRLRPAWFTFENVPGLLSSSEGRDFGIFLRTVDELGYFGAWASLDAQYFGVAQRRKRLFFVGNSRDWRYSSAVLFEPEGLCGHSAPCRETGKGVAPTIASRPTGGGGLGTDFDCDGGLIANALHAADGHHMVRRDSDNLISACLNGGMGRIDAETETFIPVRRQGTGFDLALAHGQHPPAIAFSCKDYGADAASLAPTLRAIGHDGSHANAGGQVAIAVALRGREGGAIAELSEVPSVLRASSGGGDKAHVLTNAVRRLTPRECERLQGFPDDYTLIQYRNKSAADGPRYKALGNSMAVPVMRWILSRITALRCHDPSPQMRLAV